MSGRRYFLVMAAGALAVLAMPRAGATQQAGIQPRIGVLTPDPISARVQFLEAFRQGLRELGYVEGQNVALEVLGAEGSRDRLTTLVTELLSRKVDVIVTSTTPAVQAAKQATKTIPIVAISADPVATGLVASLARPGGNITGLSLVVGAAMSGKQLELVTEMLPKVRRVGFIWDPANPALTLRYRQVGTTARTLGVQIESIEVRRPRELEGALASTIAKRVGALIVPPRIAIAYRRQIVDWAAKNRLPVMYEDREAVVLGGLMSYSANVADLFRRAAGYVDKILKGARPADLPIEQPTKFELVVNLKTAGALGITIPPSLLLRADHVIE
jgi:putative ABC transport system substrate-binding protein